MKNLSLQKQLCPKPRLTFLTLTSPGSVGAPLRGSVCGVTGRALSVSPSQRAGFPHSESFPAPKY